MSSQTEQKKMSDNELLLTQALDSKVENLNELTKAKLTAARLNALATKKQRKPGFISWIKQLGQNVGTTGSLATSAAVMALVFVTIQSPNDNVETSSQLDAELALMAMMTPELTEDPELLEQLEFIAWLEQEGQGS